MLCPRTEAVGISYKLNPSQEPAAEINWLSSVACVMEEVRGDSHSAPCSPFQCEAIKVKIMETEFCLPLFFDGQISLHHFSHVLWN